MESLISHLPIEMTVEILSRVPADSLLRSKLVSKSWRKLISELSNDPTFVAKHLLNAKNEPPTKSLVFSHFCPHSDHTGTNCRGDVFSLITLLSSDRETNRVLTHAEELDLPPPRSEAFGRLGRWRISGHCDGIVCLVQDPRTIVFCNPVTRETRALPESGSANFLGMGFGYDPRAKDYKLVKIFDDKFDQARVYSLGTNSWRVVKMPLAEHILEVLNRDGLFCEGVCHWLVQDFWFNKLILCFDFSDEEFYVIKLPISDNLKYSTDLAGLTVWNDSVALYVFSREYRLTGCLSFIEIFVLDDKCRRRKGVSLWTKPLLIGPLVNIVNTFTFLHNDECLIQRVDKRLFSYNVRTEKLSHVVVHDVDRLRHWNCFYVKSLVSLRGR